MNHDPLCPKTQTPINRSSLDDYYGRYNCQCELVARVREDMLRWPKVAEVYIKGREAGYKRGYEDATSQYRALFELPQTKKIIID